MTQMIRWHEPEDENKIKELSESMSANGWQGCPLVVWGEQLYTGAHRSEAAELAGIEYPTIDLTEIFDEAGVDFDAACWLYDNPTSDSPEMAMVVSQLPRNIKDKYGLDLE